MVIFAALFIVFTMVLFSHVFHQRIKDFLLEDVLRPLFRRLSGNQNIDERIGGNMEAVQMGLPLTPSSSSPKTNKGSEYEVFLSFRGEDTRYGFTGHLYDDLVLRGISTFMDSEKLQKGEEINKLLEYIDKSEIFVAIFSKRFAESKWCLKEVTKSVECGKEIVPVFFGVEPSDVRNQSGPFKNAFEQHLSNKEMNQEEVKKWREALKKIASLCGFNLKDMNGDEAKLKREIVKSVESKVKKNLLEVAKHPIGIETHVEKVKKMLENGGNVVGILGMGGLGKTTIANAVYNDLHKGFSGATCFLSNIREKAGEPDGLVKLQKQLIDDILKVKDISLSGGVAVGKELIKKRASDKKVLLILDDVDSVEQLDALAGGRDWFGSGSVIIITTRDEEVLQDHKVKQHEIYKPEVLNEDQSRELFLQHAFNGEEPEGEYIRLSNEVVAAAGGLPLTIEVLGSLLTCDKDVKEWEDILEKLKRIPPSKVQQRLKLSYDSLEDNQKKIFLDISCFFIGRYRKNATYMWEGCGWSPNAEIRVLVRRSLIKIDEKNQEFWMHDQIRDMGRAIVKEESSGKLQSQSRLWNYQDSWNLLQRKVPMSTEGIMLYVEEGKRPVSAPRFQEWHDLRLFDINGAKFEGSLHFPEDLKWLGLQNCQLQPPTSVSIPEAIVVLDLHKNDGMAHVLLDKCGSNSMVFDKLKFLDLSYTDITITPDFSSVPCLVELILKRCTELVEVHESVGQLTSLVRLDLQSCWKLEKLPDTICNLTSLEFLSLKDCDKLLDLPKELGNMASLKDLSRNDGMANVLLDKWGSKSMVFDKLKFLDLSGTRTTITPDFSSVPCLVELILKRCTELVEVHESVGQLTSLVRLDLKFCQKLEKLPDTICNLTSLEFLSLSSCDKLLDLPKELGNLASLKSLDIGGSTYITSLPDSMRKLQLLEHLIIGEIGQIISFDGPDLVSTSRLKACGHDFIDALPDPCCRTKTELELIDNGVEEFTNSFTRFEKVESLILKCNSLKALPAGVGQLQLKVLEVYSDNLMLLDDALPLESTEKLVLKCASLEHVPSFCWKTENLKHLNLDCKNMEVPPDWIESSSKLETLQLKGYKNKDLNFHSEHLELLSIGSTESLQQIGCFSTEFKKLKILRLVGSPMTITPNFSHFPCLEELMLTNCKQLIEVDESIGILKKLKFLKITGCNMLGRLPESICELASLEILHLEGCTSLSNLPETIIYLDSLRELHVIGEGTSKFIISYRKGPLDPLWDGINVESSECRSLEASTSWELMDALPRSCCESICSLKFTNHRTEKLTDSIGRFVNLRALTIQCHTLTQFDKICTLESIERLTVECTTLEPLPFSSTTLLGTSTASSCKNIKEAEPPLVRQSECFSQGSSERVMTKLKVLELCAKQITVTPDFSVAPSLKKLTLRGCEMLTEVHHSIGTLKNLEYLDIKGCNALEGLPNTVCHLTSLWSLQLIQEFNPSSPPEPSSDLDNHGFPETGLFKSILTCTGQLTELRYLQIRKSCPIWADVIGVKIYGSILQIDGSCLELLTSLSPCRLQSVTRLHIKDDQIEELPDCPLRQMENFEKLRLECKSLKSLPKWIRSKLENLKELTLECESFKALPKWIGKLKNLSFLKLECSSLETLPDCIASLEGLRTLQISGCKNIKGLPDSMRHLERLTSLDLSRSGILELPPWLGCLTGLTSLKLSDPENDLLLSGLSQLSSLKKLDLSGCNFVSLPSCISNFSRLEVLDVSGCKQLLSIPHLSSPVLEELNVSGCKQLHSILPLNSPVLKELDASNCMNLIGLPDFSNVRNVRYLPRLFLGGCNSLESISGLKTIAGNIWELRLPGPSGVIQCSNLSDDFKNKVFMGASFQNLREFMMTGNVIGRCHTGQQHLSFLFPDLRRNRDPCTGMVLTLDGISSPVHVAVMKGGHVLFETTLAEDEFEKNDEGSTTFSFKKREEIFEYLKEGAATIVVSTDVSNLSTAQLQAWMLPNRRMD